MSYLDYLNAFYSWLESNTLPVNAQLLYFKMLNVFNRAGWPEQVQVDTVRMMGMINAGDKRLVYRARDALAEAGLITFQKGKKGMPSMYSLKMWCDFGTKYGTENGTKNGTKCGTKYGTENGTHNKNKDKDKEKENNKKKFDLPEDFSPALQSALSDWLDYKAEKKQEYKPTGYKQLVGHIRNMVGEIGEKETIRSIRESMMANWTGIYKARNAEKPVEKRSDIPVLSWNGDEVE